MAALPDSYVRMEADMSAPLGGQILSVELRECPDIALVLDNPSMISGRKITTVRACRRQGACRINRGGQNVTELALSAHSTHFCSFHLLSILPITGIKKYVRQVRS